MPLFNPSSSSIEPLVLKSFVKTTRGSGAASAAKILNTGEPKQRAVIISNTSALPIYIGFSIDVAVDNYVAKIEPNGVWESAMGYTGEVWAWMSANQTSSVSVFGIA
ncbi:MAG: hypothetical protein HC836_11265 [Richelia sp. RM2_1_2]|nr:hypothetical protein [Richelia sp. SM1_7_0]NJO58892.1 hypothetical protein [Richelia sp. RM2_1_2]